MAARANNWGQFLAHVKRARAKPTFDAEERDLKVQIAAEVREALELARDGGDWLRAMNAAFQAGLLIDMTVRAHRNWFKASVSGPTPPEMPSPASYRGRERRGKFASFTGRRQRPAVPNAPV